MAFSIFEKVYCLNLASRPDRRKRAESELRKAGITFKFFEALPGLNNVNSFNRSQVAMLQSAGESNLLTFEDDVYFYRNPNLLINAIQQLPKRWDVLYFGANITDPEPVRISRNLVKVCKAWTTHAIAYNADAIPFILDKFNPESEQVYDDYLSSILSKMNAYVCSPMICYQRPDNADLFNKRADYTAIFRRSDKLLQNV